MRSFAVRKLIPILLLLAVSQALAFDRVVESRTIERTLELADRGGQASLLVDNIFGSIHVESHARPVVEVVARETVRARSREAFERARSEVELQITLEGNDVVLYVDGPFRENCRRESPGYTVTYDFELRVPADIDFELKTVNDGEIYAADLRGRFRVSNVNGGVELNRIAGSGDATTVNGPVRVDFVENPTEDSRFHTINGKLDMSFQPDLSADLEFKTFNGDVWSDFEVEPMPLRPARSESREGRFIIRGDSWSNVRVARGGPRLSFETLNGDILIRNARD